MKKNDSTARSKRKKDGSPGKASSIVPNLLRERKFPREQGEEKIREDQSDLAGLAEIVFSDIFEVQLADHTNVRGCFALWKDSVGECKNHAHFAPAFAVFRA